MRRIYISDENNIPQDLRYLDFVNDDGLQNEVKFIAKKTENPNATWEYLSNLDEYPANDPNRGRVKKLYLKDGSQKTVPKQVLSIRTETFFTDPEAFLDKYNIEFEEL